MQRDGGWGGKQKTFNFSCLPLLALAGHYQPVNTGQRPCWAFPTANITKAAGPQEKTAQV